MLPIDSVLLFAAALALTVAVGESRLPSRLLTAMLHVASPVLALGIVFAGLFLVDVYRIGFAHLLYYPLDFARSIGFVTLAFLVRGYALRRNVSAGS